MSRQSKLQSLDFNDPRLNRLRRSALPVTTIDKRADLAKAKAKVCSARVAGRDVRSLAGVLAHIPFLFFRRILVPRAVQPSRFTRSGPPSLWTVARRNTRIAAVQPLEC